MKNNKNELNDTILKRGIPETIQLILEKKISVDMTVRELLDVFSKINRKDIEPLNLK
jgi:hypothetical protein